MKVHVIYLKLHEAHEVESCYRAFDDKEEGMEFVTKLRNEHYAHQICILGVIEGNMLDKDEDPVYGEWSGDSFFTDGRDGSEPR